MKIWSTTFELNWTESLWIQHASSGRVLSLTPPPPQKFVSKPVSVWLSTKTPTVEFTEQGACSAGPEEHFSERRETRSTVRNVLKVIILTPKAGLYWPVDLLLELSQQRVLGVLVDLWLVLDALGTVGIPGGQRGKDLVSSNPPSSAPWTWKGYSAAAKSTYSEPTTQSNNTQAPWKEVIIETLSPTTDATWFMLAQQHFTYRECFVVPSTLITHSLQS